MTPDNRNFLGLLQAPTSTLTSKWDTIFEKNTKEWLAFKPALGLHLYPCYSCKHMFYTKKSFLDHINRRAIVLKYKCPGCSNEELVFYNRCSFHLHCRKHYSLTEGMIYLNNLEISTLPIGLAGFWKQPDIPYLFDVEEEYIVGNTFMNAQFYSPNLEDRGKDVIKLTPSDLVLKRPDKNGEIREFALKQIAINIPKCKFISTEALNELKRQMQASEQEREVEQIVVKAEPEDIIQSEQTTHFDATPAQDPLRIDIVSRPTTTTTTTNHYLSFNGNFTNAPPENRIIGNLTLPVITKIETVEEPLSPEPTPGAHKCPECGMRFFEPMKQHFLRENRPLDEKLRCGSCKLVCPTVCSFTAHTRIHVKKPPFICPDCGDEFSNCNTLITHMDDVCFHSAKSVRFRCPGRRCGKIFASEATFGPHFKSLHIDTLYQCGICKEIFTGEQTCNLHMLTHEDRDTIVKFYNCPSCGEVEMTQHQLRKHLDFHCKDLTRCMYIYMCKYCKCYFRSVTTMATHLKNCKVQKTGIPRQKRPQGNGSPLYMNSKYVSSECKLCKCRIICLKSKPVMFCTKCTAKPPVNPNKALPSIPEKCICILCKKQIDFEERRQHQKDCKYSQPHVYVENLDSDSIQECLNQLKLGSSSNSEFGGSSEGSRTPRKNPSDSGDENRPRKRHKPANKPRKPDMADDLTADQPILFDGTYQCHFCGFSTIERGQFHSHIKEHRHISTAYQCMECGECFVVKPSLVKHLMHYHNIVDTEEYFKKNDCFDRGAVNELAKVVKAPYLANSVEKNQCKVCLEKFESSEEHDKHFRVHGMAFLMQNSI